MKQMRLALSLISSFGEGQVRLKGDGGKEEWGRGSKGVKNKMYTFFKLFAIFLRKYKKKKKFDKKFHIQSL